MTALAPRQKVMLLVAAVIALLASLAATSSTTTAARVALGALAVGGLGFWFVQQRRAPRFASTRRLQLVQKIGLSPRAGVALVDVDGRSFLIVHGEGGTRIRRVSSRAAVMAHVLKDTGS